MIVLTNTAVNFETSTTTNTKTVVVIGREISSCFKEKAISTTAFEASWNNVTMTTMFLDCHYYQLLLMTVLSTTVFEPSS